MKVLALIESADHVCFRYRLNAMAWALAAEGLFLEAIPLGKGWSRIASLVQCSRFDIVVLQRKLLPAWQLAFLRRSAKRLVYDLDDALFRRDSFSSKGQASRSRLESFRRTVQSADAVLAGNDYLAQFASAYTETGQVHHLPTCVEPRWYAAANHRRSGSLARLVWIGQPSMLPSLLAMNEHLAAVARSLPQITLRVVCDRLPETAVENTELRPWSSATEARELSACDIGLSWLCDDLWSLGKCGLKVLQYMAAGLPVVANPVGVHAKLVVHGETGLLASTPAEWSEAIALLANNPGLRRRMGAAARSRIEQDYSVAVWGPRLAALLKQLVGNQPQNQKATSQPTGLRDSRIANRV